MKVILYSRVSTDDKDQDTERQLIALRKYADIYNHQILTELRDYHTGDSFILQRPEGSKISNYPEAEGILVFTIDRYSREHPTKIFQQLKQWKDKGIKIVSITEPIFNMEGEFGEILIFLITWFNNYFLSKLRKDIKSGIDKARLDGKQIGRSKAKFNQFRAYQLLFIENKSQRYVSKELGVSLATINRFKKVSEKNNQSFINNDVVSETDDLETNKEVKE